jgi:lathosterol oxidase
MMHTRWLFRRVHQIHHLSVMPTPITAFSFHPAEAVLEALIYPILLGLFSWNAAAFLIFAMLSRILNITGHLGYDFFSRNHAENKFLKVINTTFYHDNHHSKNTVNFGLYFNWWDRLLGSKDKNYEAEYGKYKGNH